MDLAIIIVSYNTRELLAECLESVLAGVARSGLSAEVRVVHNGSADGSADMVRSRFPKVRLVAHDANLGFAAGNNLALQMVDLGRESSPRFVLFLNPDTRVVGDAFGVMVRTLDAMLAAGAAGARLVHGDGTLQQSAFRFPGLTQILLEFFPLHHRLLDSRLNGRYPLQLYAAGRPFAVDHPLGAALMVRADTLAQVGGFDEQFFMYCEEVDLCRRIRASGWQILCVPQAEIVHWVAQSTRQSRDRMFVALWRSRTLMFHKHESRAFCWAARRLVRLGLWAQARRDRASHRRGEIDDTQLESRLAAYREVAAL